LFYSSKEINITKSSSVEKAVEELLKMTMLDVDEDTFDCIMEEGRLRIGLK
jgi:hypothetical protein